MLTPASEFSGSIGQLLNISTRVEVLTGGSVLIGGFMISGSGNQNAMIVGLISGDGVTRVIVRALGPTLTQFGVPNVLADPTLEVHDGNGALLASNDNWKDTQQAEIQASGKAPPNNPEWAIIITRPAGNTTAIVKGKNNTTGNALGIYLATNVGWPCSITERLFLTSVLKYCRRLEQF